MTIVQKFEGPPMELLKFVEYPFTVSRVVDVSTCCDCVLVSASHACGLSGVTCFVFFM